MSPSAFFAPVSFGTEVHPKGVKPHWNNKGREGEGRVTFGFASNCTAQNWPFLLINCGWTVPVIRRVADVQLCHLAADPVLPKIGGALPVMSHGAPYLETTNGVHRSHLAGRVLRGHLGCDRRTVARWHPKYKVRASLEDEPQSGRPRATSATVDRIIVRMTLT